MSTPSHGTGQWLAGLLTGLVPVLLATQVAAHHSFAVFFATDSQLAKVTGVVREFRFTNPHGIVTLAVNQNGRQVIWRAETNSPSILRRRGWTAGSLRVGATITMEGWPARDGSRYMRLRSATGADGRTIGSQLSPPRE